MKVWTSPAVQELDVKLTASGSRPDTFEQYAINEHCVLVPTTFPSTSESEDCNCSNKSGVAS